MRKWTNDDRMMIACCNDGTRPVIFKIERIDIPETKEEREWLEKQSFKNGVKDGSWAINTMEDLFLFAMFEIYINLVVD